MLPTLLPLGPCNGQVNGDDDTFPLDELTPGFVIRSLADTFGSTEIVCDTCHELATREISAAA